ncbi:MAG: Rieske 2Fe-2S domain-containing protein [Planctomycetaceae bacterium]|nr:Rieske 2Fe-2S domain-containing protein [Planctomycetaceae bacterium]
MSWEKAIGLEDLRAKGGTAVVRLGTKQLALFERGDNVYAIDNRCPHEGYPLSQGTVDGKCVLTCQWHNWKFDLATGKCLLGQDDVARYPTDIQNGAIMVETTGPSKEQIEAKLMAALRRAFDKREYGRMARELTRMDFNGLDLVQVISGAICWSFERFEYGMTHAHAAAVDWLSLYDRATDREDRIICMTEALDHLSNDALDKPRFPYAEGTKPWNADGFLQAFEAEDEPTAIQLIRGALAEGRGWDDLEETITRAALAHYADFGHSLIYVQKTGELVSRLGNDVLEPMLCLLVRDMIYATREELIPEFRHYGETLKTLPAFGSGNPANPEMPGLRDASIHQALTHTSEHVARWQHDAVFRGLVRACAENMLCFDTSFDTEPHQEVQFGKNWLQFTHALTFAEAARILCGKYPDLWGKSLLQMACFVGRNKAAVDFGMDVSEWLINDVVAFEREVYRIITDHGLSEPIRPCHLLKTGLATLSLINHVDEHTVTLLRAALNRYFHTPSKSKHVRRTAYQAISLVGKDFEV